MPCSTATREKTSRMYHLLLYTLTWAGLLVTRGVVSVQGAGLPDSSRGEPTSGDVVTVIVQQVSEGLG